MNRVIQRVPFFFLIFSFWFVACSLTPAFANNIVVEDVSLADQDTVNNTYDIQFDISWENSWRTALLPSATANWDAAWVFAKYSTYSGDNWSDWAHCRVSSAGAQTPTMDFADNKGVFIYRPDATSGSNDWDNIKIRWSYGAVADEARVKVRLFAIEMVLIPAGNFYLGDGTNATNRTGGSNSHFFDAADATDDDPGRDPVLISSTQPYISNVNDETGVVGDITWVNKAFIYTGYAGNLPAVRSQLGADYPTGYNAFYIMKYEISQGQYRDFLNTLTRTQQNARTASQTADQYAMSDTATVSYRSVIRCPSSIPAGAITFGCDYAANGSAGNGIFNEDRDGEWIACNYLSWADITAYADWAALRPFTELEFEKACRGDQAVVASEYAWGTATIASSPYSLKNASEESEGIAANYSIAAGNCWYSATSSSIGASSINQGPLRVGIFAANASNSGRMTSGAGYYGTMELSGNLWERIVSVMDSRTGRAISDFKGTHGDGDLSTTNSDWPPGSTTAGSGCRGGSWYRTAAFARVSDRYIAAASFTLRFSHGGGRCARTAPE